MILSDLKPEPGHYQNCILGRNLSEPNVTYDIQSVLTKNPKLQGRGWIKYGQRWVWVDGLEGNFMIYHFPLSKYFVQGSSMLRRSNSFNEDKKEVKKSKFYIEMGLDN